MQNAELIADIKASIKRLPNTLKLMEDADKPTGTILYTHLLLARALKALDT